METIWTTAQRTSDIFAPTATRSFRREVARIAAESLRQLTAHMFSPVRMGAKIEPSSLKQHQPLRQGCKQTSPQGCSAHRMTPNPILFALGAFKGKPEAKRRNRPTWANTTLATEKSLEFKPLVPKANSIDA